MIPNQSVLDERVSVLATEHPNEPTLFESVTIDCEGTLLQRSDVYEGPHGNGCSMIFIYELNNQRWLKQVNCEGPETERTTDWAEFELYAEQ